MSSIIKLCARVMREQVGLDDEAGRAEGFRLSALAAKEEYDELIRQRDEALATIREAIEERDAWRSRAERAEGELMQALGMPAQIASPLGTLLGPSPGDVVRLMQQLRDDLAAARRKLEFMRERCLACRIEQAVKQ